MSLCAGGSDIHAQIRATYPCGQNIWHYGPVMESYSNIYVSWDWIYCSYGLSGKAGHMLNVISCWFENPPEKEPRTNLLVPNPLLPIALTNTQFHSTHCFQLHLQIHSSIQLSAFLFYFNSTCMIDVDRHQAFFTNPQNWGKMPFFLDFEDL